MLSFHELSVQSSIWFITCNKVINCKSYWWTEIENVYEKINGLKKLFSVFERISSGTFPRSVQIGYSICLMQQGISDQFPRSVQHKSLTNIRFNQISDDYRLPTKLGKVRFSQVSAWYQVPPGGYTGRGYTGMGIPGFTPLPPPMLIWHLVIVTETGSTHPTGILSCITHVNQI